MSDQIRTHLEAARDLTIRGIEDFDTAEIELRNELDDVIGQRERLKAAQVRLLKVRIWRATGARPGEA